MCPDAEITIDFELFSLSVTKMFHIFATFIFYTSQLNSFIFNKIQNCFR